MFGTNFLPDAITPAPWDYNTYNYYLNITFLPFLEFSYRMTLFKLDDSDHFNNQDRSLSARIRLLEEKKYIPAVVVGSNDIYSSTGGFSVNRYFTNFYMVSTKSFLINESIVETSAGYFHNASKSSQSGGFFCGMSLSPGYLRALDLIAEYDSNGINTGAGVLIFKHLYLYSMAYDLKHFTGGFYLKFDLISKNKTL